MLCESYRQSLKDAAAGGEALPPPLKLHVEKCAACGAALAKEQELFRSIDSALWTAANAPLRASLVPQVQAGIVREPTKWKWRMPVFTFAGSMVLLAVAGLVMFSRHSERPTPIVRAIESSVVAASTNLEPAPYAVGPGTARAATRRRAVGRFQPVKGIEPEVIVSLDEQAGLRRYETLLRSRQAEQIAPVIAAQEAREIKPLEITGIDVKELAIQPLEVMDSN